MTIKTETIEQSIKIKASPHEIYEAFMDSKKHSKFTESKAKISREIGGKFSIFEGDLEGKNLELIPDKKIVQSWRSNEEGWPKTHYSTITIELESVENGTLLIFKHTEVPLSSYKSVKEGWNEYYWEPLKNMFEK
ncbi:MAG: SRPBCC domain-containing protein [Candidatus Hodarchaeota archaeon]